MFLHSRVVLHCASLSLLSLQVVLHEESCLRIASLLADGLVVQPQPQAQAQAQPISQTPSTSLSSLHYALFLFDSLDLTATLPAAIAHETSSADLTHQHDPNLSNSRSCSSEETTRSTRTHLHPKLHDDDRATADAAAHAFSGARIVLQGFSALLDPFSQFDHLQVSCSELRWVTTVVSLLSGLLTQEHVLVPGHCLCAHVRSVHSWLKGGPPLQFAPASFGSTSRPLQLDDDPACFAMWRGQPVDASQLRLAVWADLVSVSLNCWDPAHPHPSSSSSSSSASPTPPSPSATGLQCMRVKEPRLEMALLSPDGRPLQRLPPPGGTLRLGLSCCHLTANSNYQQLLFVLRLAEYLVLVLQELMSPGKRGAATPVALSDAGTGVGTRQPFLPQILPVSSPAPLPAWQLEAPADSAVLLAADEFLLRILESPLLPASASSPSPSTRLPVSDSRASTDVACTAGHAVREKGVIGGTGGVQWSSSSSSETEVVLSQLMGTQLRMKVGHRSLGGASAVSTSVDWGAVSLECIDSTHPPLPTSGAGGSTSSFASTLAASQVAYVSPPETAPAPASADFAPATAPPRRAVFWSPPSSSHSTAPPQGDTARGPCTPPAAAMGGGEGVAVPTTRSGVSGYGGDMGGWHATHTGAAPLPFLSLHLEHVLPYSLLHGGEGAAEGIDDDAHSLSLQAKVAGVRMGGGWAFNEGLLRRFDLLDEKGEPGGTLLHFIDVLVRNKALRCLLDVGAQAAPSEAQGGRRGRGGRGGREGGMKGKGREGHVGTSWTQPIRGICCVVVNSQDFSPDLRTSPAFANLPLSLQTSPSLCPRRWMWAFSWWIGCSLWRDPRRPSMPGSPRTISVTASTC